MLFRDSCRFPCAASSGLADVDAVNGTGGGPA